MEFNVPHTCAHCGKDGSSEKEMTRLAPGPGGVNKKDIEKIPTKMLGQWVHNSCYLPFFNTLKK